MTGVADYRGDGEFFMSVKRFTPDFKYLRGNSTVTLFLNDYPDNTPVGSPLGPFTITSTTDKIDTRARGTTSSYSNSKYIYGRVLEIWNI